MSVADSDTTAVDVPEDVKQEFINLFAQTVYNIAFSTESIKVIVSIPSDQISNCVKDYSLDLRSIAAPGLELNAARLVPA